MKTRGQSIVERMQAAREGEKEPTGGEDEHLGVAKDLHDAIHGHDIGAIAQVLKAIKALGHSEPEDEAPGAEAEPEPE